LKLPKEKQNKDTDSYNEAAEQLASIFVAYLDEQEAQKTERRAQNQTIRDKSG